MSTVLTRRPFTATSRRLTGVPCAWTCAPSRRSHPMKPTPARVLATPPMKSLRVVIISSPIDERIASSRFDVLRKAKHQRLIQPNLHTSIDLLDRVGKAVGRCLDVPEVLKINGTSDLRSQHALAA